MKAAEGLDGHDSASAECRDRRVDAVSALEPWGADHHTGRVDRDTLSLRALLRDDNGNQRRTAVGTGDGLGVESPIQRIGVLALASLAQGELRHRRSFTVVRRLTDDGKSRPTIGTCNEGMTEAPVRRVEQLGEAGVASGHVGGNAGGGMIARGCLAWCDDEVVVRLGRRRLHAQARDHREGRRRHRQRAAEFVDARGIPFHVDEHSARVVADEAPERVGRGEPVDIGSKPHPLNDPLDRDEPPFRHPSPRRAHSLPTLLELPSRPPRRELASDNRSGQNAGLGCCEPRAPRGAGAVGSAV